MPDSAYTDAHENVSVVSRDEIFGADVVLKVQPFTSEEISKLTSGNVAISFMQAHNKIEETKALRDGNITAIGMEYIPRISRAQYMDALSSQAAVSGYKAVLIGASKIGRFLPMLTTAAGTIRPAVVLVIGVGVAGLQAIGTARRLGATVEGYDVRKATQEQVESMGAKFVDVGVYADGEGGYARELTEDEIGQQREVLAKHVAKCDILITTAAIPGRPAPKIIFKDMIDNMKPGAVIVDIAAETGGNTELTVAGEDVMYNNVLIHGAVNLPSTMPEHASEMYSKNLENLLALMVNDEGELALNWEDEVVSGACLTHGGEIKHAPSKQLIEG
jgi:NAD(P) transhydrogenase subunit alpha